MVAHFSPTRLTAGIVCLVTCLVLALVAFAVVSSPVQGESPQPGEAASTAAGQPQPSGADAHSAVRRAWQRARDVGIYHFATELAETAYPAPAVANIGRSPQVDSLNLEGDVNLAQETVQMAMWQDAIGVAKTELRVEKGRGYVREPDGTWRPELDGATSFGPANDPLVYLGSIKNAVELGTETHVLPAPESNDPAMVPAPSHIVVTRYGFELDGPAFAGYMRDEMERQLTARGELPLGVSLDTAREYRGMTGQGEVWVDARGLPLRLTLHVVYPPAMAGGHSEADVKTDFSGYPVSAMAEPSSRQSPLAWAGSLRRQLSRADWPDIAGKTVIALLVAGLAAFTIVGRRSRIIYRAVVLAVIFSMVILPLPQAVHAGAFYQRMEDQRAQQQATQDEQRDARDFAADITGPAWDAHSDPLAAPPVVPQDLPANPATPLAPRLATATPTPAPTQCDTMTEGDNDGDGLSNRQECLIGTDSGKPDHDGDGLTDGEEAIRLGTDATHKDTDGDRISDYVEVAGFDYAGQHWYSDPLNPDTNKDGRLDGIECDLLMDVATPPAITQDACDRDDDLIPDLFDNDDDDDAVPDRVDYSPAGVVGRNGKKATPDGTYFDNTNPFRLSVQGLTQDMPAFVDLQLRPITPTHLTYAMNVLDWPSGDAEGQLQHYRNSTFASTANLAIRNTSDPASANGDLRLVPMLEIQIDGTSVPLKLAELTPVTVKVDSGTAPSSTVTFRQATTTTVSVDIAYGGGSGAQDVKIYRGTCPVQGSPVYTFTGTTGTIAGNLVNLADGDHAVRVLGGCTDMPNLINGPYTHNVIDESVLDPYGIGVREVSTQTTTLLAYVPLNMLPDDTGGGRVGFAARMLYWPGSTNVWQLPQAYRVVWALQMLTDDCVPPETQDDDTDMTSWCANANHRTPEQIRIVQTYPESWYITGLAVREDHGLDTAVIYENTGKTTADLKNQDALWMLSLGLASTFIPARDCENAIAGDDPDYVPRDGTCHNDSLTDLAVFITGTNGITVANTTISNIWSYPLNAQTTITQRLAIPMDELLVQNLRQPHQDYRAVTAMTTTKNILASFPVTSTPTLMFAQSERYRSAGIDALTGSQSVTLTLTAATNPEETLNTLKWAPYRYRNDKWEAYPADEYWDQLEIELKARFLQLYPDDGVDAAIGRMMLGRSYYMALMQGVAGACTTKPCKAGKADSAKDFVNATKLVVGKGLASVVKTSMKGIVDMSARNITTWKYDFAAKEWSNENFTYTADYKYTAASIAQGIFGPWGTLFKQSKLGFSGALIGAGVVVAGAVVAIAMTFSALAEPLRGGIHIAARVLLALNVVLQTVCVVSAIAKVVTTGLKGFTALSSNLSKGLTKAGIIGLVLAIVATWGAFIASAAIGGMAMLRSIAFTGALAGTIGATLGIILVFIVLAALGPLGALIGAIIGLIDALVAMLCNAFLTEEQQKGQWAQWLCGGITGFINKLFTFSIYSGTIMVELNPKEEVGPPLYPRLALSNFDSGNLVNPDIGIVAGNKVKYFVNVTNTIDLVPVPVSPLVSFWFWQFSDKKLSSSAFKYRWQTSETDFFNEVQRFDMEDQWLKAPGGRPFYYVWDVRAEDGISLPPPGINMTSTLYLSEAYAIPAQECWGVMMYSFCYIRSEKSTNHYDIGQSVAFDVLPATLDGFYSLTAKGGGYSLGWGQSGNLTFPTQPDADGDGVGGLADDNDSRWDNDNDGLRDGYEIALGGNPSEPDTDGDGLSDAEELRLGTNLTLPDSDGDGLRDNDEVAGWNIVVTVRPDGSIFTTRIHSDPQSVDADGDTLTDFQEQLYGFNPWMPNNPEVLTLDSQISEIGAGGVLTPTDKLVKPGDSLHYTATVANQLENRYAQGLLGTVPSTVLQNQGAPQSFVLYPEQEKVMTGTINVSSAAASGVYSLTQVAAAQITNWSDLSGQATLWLPFDEAATATTWMDRSGNRPVHDAVCTGTGCTTSPTGGRYGGALDLSRNAGYARANIGVDPNHYGVSFWFRSPTFQNYAGLFSANESQDLAITLYGNTLHVDAVYLTDPVANNGRVLEYNITGHTLQDGNWHHIAQSFDPTHGFEVYVDGARYVIPGYPGTALTRATSYVTMGSSSTWQTKFTGLIDDVRLFPHSLSEADIQALLNEPVFSMSFESTTAWTDTSVFHAPVTCTSAVCPDHLPQSVVGHGATFDSYDGLSVGGTDTGQLDLSGGRFTMSAWIYPKTGCIYDNQDQLILGDSNPLPRYPSLYRYQTGMRYKFTSGTTLHSGFSWGSAQPLTLASNTWQHIVATFDKDEGGGVWKLYQNGVLKWEDTTNFTGVQPNAGTAFTIGSGTTAAKAFCGSIDEVRIFNKALTADEVEELTVTSATALHLPLDEPPGSNVFQDTGLNKLEATCSGSSCPTMGVPGRVGRAAWFEGAKNTRLALANSIANRFVNMVTVSAWIKPRMLMPAVQRIAGSARTHSPNGWGFGITNSELIFSTFNVKNYVTSGAGLQPNKWYHVAAVMNEQNAVSFYVNGVLKGTITHTAAATADMDDDFMVGASMVAGSATPVEVFNGEIDDLWVLGWPLQSAGITRLYGRAPVMQLRFDEAMGATRFADSASPGVEATCSGDACPLAGEGVPGKLNLAAQFDGQNDVVELPYRADLAPTTYSVGLWVKPTTVMTSAQQLIGRWGTYTPFGYPPTREIDYQLIIEPGSLLVRLTASCNRPEGDVIISALPLLKDTWNHVMAVEEGTTLRLYINGSLSVSKGFWPYRCTQPWPVRIGGQDAASGLDFAGQIDEVVLYNRALTDKEINEMFLRDGGVVQDRQSRNITVDANPPVVQLTLPGDVINGQTYLPFQPVQLSASAVDTRTDVSLLELSWINSSGALTTIVAPRCTDEPLSSVWCPTFTPSGGGSYQIQAFATDKVGNRGASATHQAFVDRYPPSVTLNVPANNQVSATRDSAHEDRWLVPLNGTVSDPGSGVGIPADGVRVTMRTPSGDLAGADGQVATINGTDWSIQYAIVDSNPTRSYDVTVQALDRIGQMPGLSPEQMLQHSATATGRVTVHARPPRGYQDHGSGNVPSSVNKLEAMPTLRGIITTQPVPVEVTWTTGANGAQEGLAIDCSTPSASTLYTGPAGTFAAGSTYAWDGSIHRSSGCRVTLPVASGSGDITGTIKVCNAQVATWNGGYTSGHSVQFTASSASCPAQLSDAGIGGADVAFTPNLPGSAFLNEAPPAGIVVHLPFEDGPDQQGNLSFRDVAGNGNNGTCSGTGCPASGQVGHTGNAAEFDGVDDYVNAGSNVNLANSSLSVAFWAKRGTTGTQQAVIGQGTSVTNNGLFLGFRASNTFACSFMNNSLDTPVYTDTKWHHWTCTYDAVTKGRTIYRDGVQVAQGTATANYQGSGNLYIGTFAPGSFQFNGLIDEARVYTRTLAAADVKALYLGSEPVLALPFDEPWAVNGTLLADASGWRRQATLSTGAVDINNKAIAGQVGSYALRLDGQNDYASLGDVDEADSFADFTISQWFRVDSLGKASVATDFASPVSKGLFSGNGWAVLVNRDYFTPASHRVNLYINGAVAATLTPPSGAWQEGRWYHYLFTRSGSVLKGYLDGAERWSSANTTVPAATTFPLLVGKNDTVYLWQGGLDDLRLYRRSLAPVEVQALYRTAWQAATLGQTGAAVQVTSWQAQVPAGLEGSFKVNLRTSDTAGHTEIVREREAMWSGSIDSLAPRVTLYRTPSGTSYRYTTLATDFNLVSDGFSSPCGSTGAATYFQSPWYLALASSSPKLYQLSADCTLPAGSATEQATARDSYGNVTTVGVTTAAPPDEMLERPELKRWQALQSPALALDALSQAPQISFAPTVLTATAYYEPQTVDVTGLITGSQGVTALDVAVGGARGSAFLSIPAPDWPYTMTWRFPWRLANGLLTDGLTYTAVATATDIAAQTAVVTGTLTLDVAPPAAMALTLTSNGTPVATGSIIRTAGADLLLTWTPSSDGSGLSSYQTEWTIQTSDGISTTVTTHDPSGTPASLYSAGEAQRLAVQVGAQDTYGNLRWQKLGPVYVDGPQTPDYIELPGTGRVYDGWLDSGCSLLGTDHRGEQILGGRGPQQLYGTWDRQALRLAWTGGNWNDDGDLFIYLDTASGGTETTFSPYPVAGGVISLPVGMAADALIWVRDSRTATLLHWDGVASAWTTSGQLSGTQYRFDASRNGGQTDLALPFALLGLTESSGIGLLAFAAEEPAPDSALQIWATAPAFNSANSPRANPLAAHIPAGASFALSHLYRWAQLGDGLCPNGRDGSQPGAYFADTNPQITLSADPPGGALVGMGGGAFWLGEPGAIEGELLSLIRAAYPPIADGQQIVYTISYRNRGTQTARGVHIELSPRGAMRVLDTSIDLGDIPPGAEAVATFRAVADSSQAATALLAVHGLVYDASHTPAGLALDRFWVVHHVDVAAPGVSQTDSPQAVVGIGQTLLTGSAHDESGVTQVQVEVQMPGRTTLLSCPAPRASDGRWSCPWDVTASNGGVPPANGTQVGLRVRASDPFGHTAWSTAQTLIVDAAPPTVTVDMSGITMYSGNVVHRQAGIGGEVFDEHGVGGVEGCADGVCATADLQPAGSGAVRWHIARQDDILRDHVARHVTITAVDTLGNRTPEPLSFTLYVDDVPPVITVSQVITQVLLGSTRTVLSGTASDGGTVSGMRVRSQAPDGSQALTAVARDGDGWSFDLAADLPGQYVLQVEATDEADNTSVAGPYVVNVACTNAGPIVASLVAVPDATSPFSLTLTVSIRNTGPEMLPAGMPVAIYVGEELLWEGVTAESLAAGAQETVRVPWQVDGPGYYDVRALLNNPPSGSDPHALTLCNAPNAWHQAVGVGLQKWYFPFVFR